MMDRRLVLLIPTLLFPGLALGQMSASETARIDALEAQLTAAQSNLQQLQSVIESLASALAEVKGQSPGAEPIEPARVPGPESFRDRMLVSDLGHDEREGELEPRPELFIQSRYHANAIDEATDDDITRNFGLSRMELRWAGRVSEKVGMGFEIQYHPAPDGAAEELVNDAFVELYPSDAITIRAGQFVKPFGFDIQHSSSMRESPERGIFAGYFFPGQRDRGLMVTADLGNMAAWLNGTSVYAGIFNGNRFFNDNNDDLNFNLRIRKVFDSIPLAIGASLQRGTQVLPPGISGDPDEHIFGIDAQYVIGRLGIRAEYVRGNTPSTLLALDPEFVPGFVREEKSSGVAAFFNYNLNSRDDIYWRWDRFDNDPVTGRDIEAFNVGYLRSIGPNSRIGVDYQTKNDVTFNDDELNTRLSVTWNVLY